MPQNREVWNDLTEVKTAHQVGVQAIQTTIMPGRRDEQFKLLAEFREYEQRGQKMLELAVPIQEKQRVLLLQSA